jgi:hypothetical protein
VPLNPHRWFSSTCYNSSCWQPFYHFLSDCFISYDQLLCNTCCGQPCLITVWFVYTYTCAWHKQPAITIEHWWWWLKVIKDTVSQVIF